MPIKQSLGLLGKGFCMGTADVIPGVSGGTMALILGIYQRLLTAIRSFDLFFLKMLTTGQWRRAFYHIDIALLIPLAIGIFAALLFFTRVISLPNLMESDPEAIFGFFFGLIAASIVVLVHGLRHFDRPDYACLFIGIVSGWLLVNMVPISTPNTVWFIMLSGALAICALVLPGISGSFILLILKKYAYILNAISQLDFSIIVPFAIGAALGLIGFTRILTWLLRHFYQRTLVTIVGVLIGSLWMIWPFQERTYEVINDKMRVVASDPVWPPELGFTACIAFALMGLGALLVAVIHWIGCRKQT